MLMLPLSYPSTQYRWIHCLSLIGLLLLTSCSTVAASLTDIRGSAVPIVSIEKVKPESQLGSYTIFGQAQLPDQTPLMVSATRPLKTQQAAADTAFYAILDRQQTVVEDRQWVAQLQLLQTDPGGGEQWQFEAADSSTAWMPESEVSFTATLDPALQTSQLREQLNRDRLGFETGTVRINDDGEPYAIATQTITIAPPQWQPPDAASDAPIETRTVIEPQTSTRPSPPNQPPLLPKALIR